MKLATIMFLFVAAVSPVAFSSPNLPFPKDKGHNCCAACGCEVEAVVLKYRLTYPKLAIN